jgi:hypothetical protein
VVFSAWIFQNLFVVLLNSTCYETHLRKIQLKFQFNEVGRYFKNMIPKQMSPLGTHTHMHTFMPWHMHHLPPAATLPRDCPAIHTLDAGRHHVVCGAWRWVIIHVTSDAQ